MISCSNITEIRRGGVSRRSFINDLRHLCTQAWAARAHDDTDSGEAYSFIDTESGVFIFITVTELVVGKAYMYYYVTLHDLTLICITKQETHRFK